MTSGLQTYKQKLTTTAKTEYVKSETKKNKNQTKNADSNNCKCS